MVLVVHTMTMRIFLIRQAIMLLIICSAGLMTSMPVCSQAPQLLRGPAFSDPEYQEDMPEEWRTQAIVRDKAPADTDIAVTLDQHLYPALLPLIQEYAKNHHLKIAVHEGTCGISARLLADKKADIGGFCCPAANSDRLPGLVFHTMGIASLAVIVHPDNPVTNIETKTVRGLFQGAYGYWGEVAEFGTGKQKDTMIRPVGRLHCKLRPGHWRLILDNEDLFSPRLNEVSTIPDMFNQVAKEQGAIGYEVLWMAHVNADAGKVKRVKIDNHHPQDSEALVKGEYPFYRTYNITTWSEKPANNPKADALVDYLLQNVDKLDARYGIIPAQQLRAAGWKFKGDELIGEPD